jgi:hypothetical protein
VTHHQSENGYNIWSFQGKLLHTHRESKFYQFLWRPRHPSLLSKEKENASVTPHARITSGTQEASARWRSFEVGGEVVDEDGERCRIRSIDPEDVEKPYELEYPSGAVYWAAQSGISELADAAPSDLHAVEMASSGGWSQVPTKTKRSARHSREDGSVAQAPRLSRFQLYVTGAKGLSASEVRRMFSKFTKHDFGVELPQATDGAAFVKFRTSKAAEAAVMQSPISHKGLAIRVQYLDLARQSHNVDHNVDQERILRNDEHRYLPDEL